MTRRSHHVVLVGVVLLAVGAAGSAEANLRTYKWTDPSLESSNWDLPNAAVVSNIIYLNNCAGGCQLSPGQNNATTNRSSILSSAVNIPAYNGSATQWNQIVSCVRQTYAPFNVQIVTDRPPAGTNYHMAIVAGRAANAGQQNGVLGVSPFSCGYIPNAISFTFANEAPNSILDLCWTVAQETAHSWGLDHKYDNRDPMTYLQSGPAQKAFQNAAGSCGEYSARQCSCNYAQTGSQSMNSYALIMATFGANMPDATPPVVAVTSPSANAQVTPGFGVTATISDNVAVTKAELRLDGTLVGTKTSAPWTWTTPATLAQGSHRVQITAFDAANNMASAFVDVAYGTPDPDPGDMPGDPGTGCMTGADCVSGQCVIDSDGNGTCDGDDTGPGDDGNNPGTDDGTDGGAETGCSSSGSPSLLAGLLCAALFARRRRRSAYSQ
jgi:hypothetical protein